jgi:hypothetical protein
VGKLSPIWQQQTERVALDDPRGKAATGMAKDDRRAYGAEPVARLGAGGRMSAQLRPEAAPPLRATLAPLTSSPFSHAPAEPGEAAFEAWLKRELGRLYDQTLVEPVPDELARLIEKLPPKSVEKKA